MNHIDTLNLALEGFEATLNTLDDANSTPGGPIADTIWYSEHETLFDYIAGHIERLRQAIEQAEHAQPVAWVKVTEHWLSALPRLEIAKPHEAGARPVFLHQQPRPVAEPHKPLTEEQVRDGGRKADPGMEDLCNWSFKQGVRFAEAAHGIKGEA